jgi:hypothetical protein
MREVLPGSVVKIKFHTIGRIQYMEAVQLVREPPPDSPFDPVPDDDPS